MGITDRLKRIIESKSTGPMPAPTSSDIERVRVPEIDATVLLSAQRNGEEIVVLDCREPFEWRQARIPKSLHMPMHQIPLRLAELDPTAEITVVCAHGVRSLTVAEYLIRNGFNARSLKGGIATWMTRGGDTEHG